MSAREEEGEGDSSVSVSARRRQPQSLNQKNAELLQSLARLRVQRIHSQTLPNPHFFGMESAVNFANEQPQKLEPPLQNEGKSYGKVKVAGRRRLCKVSTDDIALSSHSRVSDESATCERVVDDYSEVSNVQSQDIYKKERPDKKPSKSRKEKKYGLDEISSKLDSLRIGNSKSVVLDDSISSAVERAKFSDTTNSCKDKVDSENYGQSLHLVNDKCVGLDNSICRAVEQTKILDTFNSLKDGTDSENDEESVACVEDKKQDVSSPDFESAVSILSSVSVKAGDGEEDSAESSRVSSLHTGGDAGEHENSFHPVNAKAGVHIINGNINANVRSYEAVEQKEKLSNEVCSTIPITSSSGRPDSLSSEDENDIYSAESVRANLNIHAPAKWDHESKECLRKESKNVHIHEELTDSDEDKVSTKDAESITYSNGRQTYTLPGKIAKLLYAHQREGIKWLWVLHCKSRGGILGDDMGLGKTMQVSAFLVGLFSSGLIKCALIVAPKTLLAHWSKELSVVGLASKTRDYSGSPGSSREYALQHVLQVGGVLLTTYDVVRNNWKAIRGDYHGRDGYGDAGEDIVTWDYIILDEGHIIKNPSTQRAKSLREIPSAHRIILSGTPIQNNLREMWALFDFCCPGLLGDKTDFKGRYEDLILRANDKKASDRQKRIGSAVAQELRKQIQPYFLRRLKSEVFPESGDSANQKLAKKDDIIVWLRLTECQRQLYTAFLNSEAALSSVDGSALAALTVLKKICDHPALLTKRAADDIAEGMESMLKGAEVAAAEEMAASLASIADLEDGQKKHESVSCKIVFLMALFDNLIAEDHRVLVFAQTRKMLNIIQEEIKARGYGFLRIDGTTKACDREKFVNEFQGGDEIPIFLLTSQVGGLGLTLTGADRVVVVDPAWNPSTDNQSVDRAYRIGQLKNVLVYRLMTCGTIEEKIYRKQVFKGGLFKTATEHKEQTRYFSQQELHELFSIPESGFDVSLTQQQLHEEHDSQHKIDDSLKQHIKFLEGQGIAGVSHHNLLYSKTAPVQPPVPEDEDALKWDRRKKEYAPSVSRYPPSKHSSDDVRNGSEYAFRPKDHKPIMCKSEIRLDDTARQNLIKEEIKRLSITYANKDMISRLSDKGEKICNRMKDLTNQLNNMQRVGVKHMPGNECSPDSVVSQDSFFVDTHEFEGDKLHKVESIKENLQRGVCEKAHLSQRSNIVNIDDMSEVLGKLSVQDSVE